MPDTTLFPNRILLDKILPLALIVLEFNVVAVSTLPAILPVPLTIPVPNNKLPPVILPLVLIGLEPNAAKFATTLVLP